MPVNKRPVQAFRKWPVLSLIILVFAAVTLSVFSRGSQMFSVISLNEPVTSVSSDSTLPSANVLIAINTVSMLTAPTGTVHYDFDGDGKADIGRWHGSNSEFRVKYSGGGTDLTATIGVSIAKPAPFDYDNDGKIDAVVFRNGTWTIKKSSDGTTTTITGFGQSGDIPVPGNWVGTAAPDAAVFRPSTGNWYFRDSNGGSVTSLAFGASGDIPVAGNYDGDGYMDMAVFRPSTPAWHIQGSTSGYNTFPWGLSTDVPLSADFDGDGKSDPVVYRGSSGTWYALKSSTSYSTSSTQGWGNYGDQPVPADYDGDGKADYAVWRPTTGIWYIIKSSDLSYDYKTLGVAGDVAVPSSFIKQVGAPVSGSALSALRMSPRNSTGGTDLYSQNFGWGSSLVGLPGRSGLDAGFGISYNSLLWIKDANTNSMIFDPDTSNVTPGFRLGLPVIEAAYYQRDASVWSYMMVSPSGARTEFRQTTVSNTYESADSSYTQFVTQGATNPNDTAENITIAVTTTDGTQMKYVWKTGAFRCTEIKDRNGNYLSITYDSWGNLTTMTDTLGRVITVNYDSEHYPISITQPWKASNGLGSTTIHTWASFSYTTKTVDVDFASSLTVYGPSDGTVIKVLDKVTYADTSWTKFYYNGYLQVSKIESYADDDHKLNHVRTNLENPSPAQTDCPRLTETRNYTETFNGGMRRSSRTLS